MPMLYSYNGQQSIGVSSALPKYGVGPYGVDTEAEIDLYLTETMPDQNEGVFSQTSNAGEYLYFMSPRALGAATFVNDDNGFQGGWDGATWPLDDIGGSGPIAITYQGERWYLYRSDFHTLGNTNYRVSYHNPVEAPIVPVSMVITHVPSIVENSAGSFPVVVTYSDNSEVTLPDGAGIWESDSSSLVFGVTPAFTTGEVVTTTPVNINFTYIEKGVTLNESFNIDVSDVPITPVSSQIIGPNALSGQDVQAYTLEVTYSDNSKQNLVPAWSVNLPVASVDGTGIVTVTDIGSSVSFTLSAVLTVDNVNLDVSLSINATPYAPPVPNIRYGKAGYGSDVTELDALTAVTNEVTDPLTVTLSGLGPYEYGYAAALKSEFNTMQAKDTSNNFLGGWDGATWPDQDIGAPGPKEITYQGAQWMVWRTDFGGTSGTFELTFSLV